MSTDRSPEFRGFVKARPAHPDDRAREARIETAEPAEHPYELRALFVTHGMGEQLRYEPTDAVVQGLARGDVEIEPQAVVMESGQALQRLRLTFPESRKILDVYEAYWAPLTEGRVTARETIAFLLSGAINGLMNAKATFCRRIFRHVQVARIPLMSSFFILLAALTLVVFIGIDAVGGAVVVFNVFKSAAQETANLMTTIAIVTHNLIIAGAFIALAMRLRKREGDPPVLLRICSAAGMIAFYASLLVLLLAGCLLAVQVVLLELRLKHLLKAAQPLAAAPWPCEVAALALPFLVIIVAVSWRSISHRLLKVVLVLGVLVLLACAFRVAASSYDTAAFRFPAVSTGGAPKTPAQTSHGSLWKAVFDTTPPSVLIAAAATAFVIIVLASARLAFYRPDETKGPGGNGQPPTGVEKKGAGTGAAPGRFAPLAAALNALLRKAARIFAETLLKILHVAGVLAVPVLAWSITALVSTSRGVPAGDINAFIRSGWWFILLGVAWFVKGFVVSYVGDVAAYVSSHKLDRFFEIRSAIKKIAADVAMTMYAQKSADGAPLYESIAVLGHSLGSVIAYDTLNAMLVAESIMPARNLAVRARTTMLLTCGSPLDKIAYIYATASSSTSDPHDVLAAATQPLIDQPRNGEFEWINVWSGADIISGPIDFYGPVTNRRDPHATTPLAAHTEYFTGVAVPNAIRNWLGV